MSLRFLLVRAIDLVYRRVWIIHVLLHVVLGTIHDLIAEHGSYWIMLLWWLRVLNCCWFEMGNVSMVTRFIKVIF